ncbi:tail fiber protein [Pantoea phage vB_PagS_AAS21]|uniref:Tail fiber protein n=1 Tax=Pantoea phage vB_PagS_AAS21 TaxID=2575261 RepID=A0A4Y5P1C8_9CAUD|nr:tail fiber protein [Pantoea phage vB_PagS_AAS21]
MARTFMPKSGTMMPYIVLNRDAAVAGVFTVDGEAGSVDLTGKYLQIADAETTYAKLGSNNDITNLLALSGPLRLGGDAAADNQAVTLRQLISAVAGAGGSGGASLNGVMNNFLGAVEWFNGSRAKLPSGHLASDGQLLKRSDYPDLWNAINSGVYVSVSDADWQSTPTARGAYSTGDGSTTFRLPDLNGVWQHPTNSALNSIPALFLRGDGAVPNTGTGVGVIRKSAAPNITGGLSAAGAASLQGGSGALYPNGPNNVGTPAQSGSQTQSQYMFDASRSNSIYGQDAATEVRPNSVRGIWLIRVNGKFSAAGTNFNVINSVDAIPATGGIAYGGDVRSALQLTGADYLTARMRTRLTVGKDKVLELGLVDTSGTTVVTSPTVDIISDGSIAITAAMRFRTPTKSQELNIGFRSGSESEVLFNYTNGVKTLNFNNLAATGFGSVFALGPVTGTDLIGYGTIYARGNAPASPPPVNTFLSSPSLRSYLWGRGGNTDPQGAFFGFYHQENVGNYARGVVELNGYGITRNWLFSNDGSLAGPGGLIQGAASDIRLKFDIKPAKEGAGERIDKLGVVEYVYADTGVTQRGFLSQQADTVDELYTAFGGENETADGDKFEILNLIDRAVLADVVMALQEARATIKELTSRITELENK